MELTRKQQSVIDLRWKEWEPLMTIDCRRVAGYLPYPDNNPIDRLFRLKVHHRFLMVALLDAGVSWKAIRRGRLDDPLQNEDLFQFQIRAAIERRRTRLGRVKGVRHDHR